MMCNGMYSETMMTGEMLAEKRNRMAREAWIKNVVRCLGYDYYKALELFNKIEKFQESRPGITLDQAVDAVINAIGQKTSKQ